MEGGMKRKESWKRNGRNIKPRRKRGKKRKEGLRKGGGLRICFWNTTGLTMDENMSIKT